MLLDVLVWIKVSPHLTDHGTAASSNELSKVGYFPRIEGTPEETTESGVYGWETEELDGTIFFCLKTVVEIGGGDEEDAILTNFKLS